MKIIIKKKNFNEASLFKDEKYISLTLRKIQN